MVPPEAAQITGDMLEKGGPWGLLAICFGVVAFLYFALRKESDGRLEDQREMARQLMAVKQTIAELVDSTEARTEALEKSIEAQQATTRAIEACSRAVGVLSDAERALTERVQAMRESMIAKGLLL